MGTALYSLNEHALYPMGAPTRLFEDDRLVGMRQTSLLDAVWIEVKDGNDTARDIFSNHYSADSRLRDGSLLSGSEFLIIGPGEKILLVTPCARAAFGWRKEKFRMDGQAGVNCCFFRNEGAGLASDLIQEADVIAWQRWPGERLFTFVDPGRIRHKRDPGRCFLRAGWRYCGWTKGGLRILECLPNDQESGQSVSVGTGMLVQKQKEDHV